MFKDIIAGLVLITIIIGGTGLIIFIFKDVQRAPSRSEEEERIFKAACTAKGGTTVWNHREWTCIK